MTGGGSRSSDYVIHNAWVHCLSVPCGSYCRGLPDGHTFFAPSIKYPMLSQVLKTRWTMFDQLPDDTNALNGSPASRQTVYYRVIGWPASQTSMHCRALAIHDTAGKWSTTFKQLQSAALPGEPDNIASMMTRLYDVLRGWTVQVSVTDRYTRELPCTGRYDVFTVSARAGFWLECVFAVARSLQPYGFSYVGFQLLHYFCCTRLIRLLCSCGGMDSPRRKII